jgi:ribulose-phosphate 3-epimerase
MLKIAPSVLAADFGRLGEQVAECERAGADLIHFDAMDGHFVPNISIGPVVLQAVRRSCRLRIDVHLMISDPGRYLEAFADAGADTLIVHVEASIHLHRVLEQIRKLGKRSAVALNPATPAASLSEVLDSVDQILVMTVNPGFGGQTFIRGVLAKIEQINSMTGTRGLEIGVDGGVDVDTAPEAQRCGANLLIAGTSVFHEARGIGAAIAALRAANKKDQ